MSAFNALNDAYKKQYDNEDNQDAKTNLFARCIFYMNKYIRLADEDDDKREAFIAEGPEVFATFTIDFANISEPKEQLRILEPVFATTPRANK